MFSAVIIDDQKICTEMLLDALSDGFPDVKVMAVAHSGKDGIQAIRNFKPNLVILDVEMPHMNGFQMLSAIEDPSFDIIFVTAHNEYSVEALRLSALDYLVKPVNRTELRSAINRMHEKRPQAIRNQLQELLEKLQNGGRPVKQIALPSGDGLVFIQVSDIIHCESDSNYTTLHLTTGKALLVTKTLKDVEALLPSPDFFRIHHSHLINMNHIRKYVRGNAGYVVMTSGANVSVARNKKEEFLRHFAHL